MLHNDSMTAKPAILAAAIEQIEAEEVCSNARENTFYLSCCHEAKNINSLGMTDTPILLSPICHCCHWLRVVIAAIGLRYPRLGAPGLAGEAGLDGVRRAASA